VKPSCQSADHRHATTASAFSAGADLERAAQLLRALGDASRLRLLQLLAQREWCVTELVESLQEKFPTVSQRLRLLRSEGLVRRRRAGKHVFYALADRHVADLMENALAHARELEAGPARRVSAEET
jgi:ArsR family transcriptional regulator